MGEETPSWKLVAQFISNLGLDLNDPHLMETPLRVAKMYHEELCASVGKDPLKAIFGGRKDKGIFPNKDQFNEMIIVREIPFYSICAHHLIPFFGMAHVGYVPSSKLIGLSKIARIVEFFSRRPQVQEQLTHDVVEFLTQYVEPVGVICIMEGRHLCLEQRGVQKPGTITTTSAMRGELDKHEFLTLLQTGKLGR